MPKLIAPVAHRLYLVESENEELTKKISELTAELLEWKAYAKRHGLPGPRQHGSRPTTPRPNGERGFLKATKASLNRSMQSPGLETQEQSSPARPRTFTYDSGPYSPPRQMRFINEAATTLIDFQGWNRFSQPTESSLNKRLPNLKWLARLSGSLSWDDERTDGQRRSSGSEKYSAEEYNCEEVKPDDPEDETLAERVGLRQYLPVQLESIPIPGRMKHDLLGRYVTSRVMSPFRPPSQ